MTFNYSSHVDKDELARKSSSHQIYKHNFFDQYRQIRQEMNKEGADPFGVTSLLFFTHESKAVKRRYSFHDEDVDFVLSVGKFHNLGNDLDNVNGIKSINVNEDLYKRIAMYVMNNSMNRKIALYKRDEKGRKWVKERTVSSGNPSGLEDFVLKEREQDSNIGTECLILYDKKSSQFGHPYFWGLCRSNVTDKFKMKYFRVQDTSLCSNLEMLMGQLSIKNFLYSNKLKKENPKLLQDFRKTMVTQKSNIDFEEIKIVKNPDSVFDQLVCERSKKKMIASKDENMIKFLKIAVATLCIHQSVNESNYYGDMELEEHRLENFMKLDSTAMTALNIFPSQGEVNQNASLVGLLKHTKTRVGDRRLLNWIRQPLVKVEDIRRRQDLVRLFMDEGSDTSNSQLSPSEIVKSVLRTCPDLDTFVSRLISGKAKLREVCKVYQFLINIGKIKSLFKERKSDNPVFKERYKKWKEIKSDLDKFNSLIEHSIDIKKLKENEYYVDPSYSDNLTRIHGEIKRNERKMIKKMNDLCQYLDIENVEDKPQRKHLPKGNEDDFGYCLKLSGKGEQQKYNKLPKKKKQKKGIEEIKHTKNMLLITNDRIKEYALRVRQNIQEFEEEQEEQVKKIIDVARTFMEVFLSLIEEVSLIDIVCNFACLAEENDWVLPTVLPKDQQRFVITGGRHPCVEKTLSFQQGGFIKNDLSLSMIGDGIQLLIITGPNMGGKSTFIRQNAVICIMAQIGCPVPAISAEISVRDGIYARIGANDSQYDGVSTFMAEMVETSTILSSATQYSLLVIDELGRGTSTYEGFGIAWAICEEILNNLKCFCLFATHFHRLGELEKYVVNDKGVERYPVKNFHVSYDQSQGDKVTLLYELKKGVCKESFGIEVTQKCNFPFEVIEQSKVFVNKLKKSNKDWSVYKKDDEEEENEGEDDDDDDDEIEMNSVNEKRRKRARTEADEYKRRIVCEFGRAMVSLNDNEIVPYVVGLKKKIQSYMTNDDTNRLTKKILMNKIRERRKMDTGMEN